MLTIVGRARGHDNPLSNFFPCDLRVFGEHHKTAEHAYQLTKAIRSGNTDAAQKVRDAETALDAKRIGNSVKDPQGWSDDKETVMEEIVTAKADQIAEVKAVLEKLDSNITFAEGTFDMFWGTGLDKEATLYTKINK
uniref:NADAR domain-containing protein n=1 Tax=Magallana gigas TaxID=29159 RepID=A0A8W8IUL8_MAGGI